MELTFEMAEFRVSFGAELFAPNSLFILCGYVCCVLVCPNSGGSGTPRCDHQLVSRPTRMAGSSGNEVISR